MPRKYLITENEFESIRVEGRDLVATRDNGTPVNFGQVVPDISPEMQQLLDDTVTARDQAEVFSATNVPLQDAAIANRINTPGSDTDVALGSKYASIQSLGDLADRSSRRSVASFVSLGDSRTMLNGNVLQSDVAGDSVVKLDRGYITWAMVLLRQRMEWLKNGGVGGNTVAQMLARTDGLLALNPGWVIGMGVINSVNAGVSAASIIDDLSAIFDKCAAAGARVVWGTDWMSTGTDTNAKKVVLAQTNEWLRRQVGVRPEFYLADYAARMVDPVTGTPIAAYASDNLHQDGPGGLVMARELVKVLEPLVPPADRLLTSNADPTNLLVNGMFEGDSGGSAPGWAFSSGGTATRTKVARTDGYPGSWQQVKLTGATGTRRVAQDIAADTPGSWVMGDRLVFEVEFETDADGWAPSEFSAGIQLISSSAEVFRAVDCAHAMGTPSLLGRPESGVFRTPALLVDGDPTHVRPYIQLIGDGTIRIARARLYRIT